MANPHNLNFGATYGKPIVESMGGAWTPQKARFFNAWGLAEGTEARNNPFATTREDPQYGNPDYFNRLGTGGVQNYRDLRTGIRASIDTIKNGHYNALVDLIKDPNATAEDMAKAVANSPWGTGTGVLRVLGASTGDIEAAASASAQRVSAIETSQTQIQQQSVRPVLQPSASYLSSMRALGGGAAFVADLSERLAADTPQLPAAAQAATNPEFRAQNWGGTTKPKFLQPTGNNTMDKVLSIAHQQIGKPYVWGASSPKAGFDCSGLIEYAFEAAGIPTPGRITTHTAVNMGKSVKNGPYAPGDWIITNGGEHMVMYVGGGQVIAAPHKGEVVQYQPLSRFKGDIVDVRRVVQTTPKKATRKGSKR